MSIVKKGKNVSVHYTGREKGGKIFDSSRDKNPLSFVFGMSDIMPGFESGISGMKKGETKKFEISPENGYGPVKEILIGNVSIERFEESNIPSVGDQLQLVTNDEKIVSAKVVEIESDFVKVDVNHPMAGKTLEFEVEIIDVTNPSKVDRS
ncbi:MAG: peptidylprolyl isomerase [Candidatus Electryonea clarkiae]|nr:peptidylprolyl isomerase [Candidatus Electryonea clarkiae]